MQKRMFEENAYIRNLFGLLSILVVSGHFIEQCLSDSWVSKGLFLFVFSFHMPLLIFLAGIIFKEIETDKQKIQRAAIYSLCLYVLMKIVTCLVRAPFTGKLSFSLLSESGAPWIFLSVAVYFLLAYCLKNINKKKILIVSLLLALVCGYSDAIGDFLVLSRTIVFFPFFITGWMYGIDRTERVTEKTWVRVLGVSALVLALIVFVFFAKECYFLRPLFTGRNSYTAINGQSQYGPLYRLLSYAISTVLLVSALTVTPRKNLGKYCNYLGTRFVQIYFLHRPLLYVLTGLGVYDWMDQTLGWKLGRVMWIMCGFVCMLVLSLYPIKELYWTRLQKRGIVQSMTVKTILPINNWKKCAIWFSITFIIAFSIHFYPFYEAGKSFIWSNDGRNFHVTGLMVYGTYFRNFIGGLLHGEINISQFNFNIGYGMDNLLFTLPSYAEPLNLLSIVVPETYSEYLYNILAIIRIFLVGVSFLIYCFYMKKDCFSSYIAALVYVFCNFVVAGGLHATYFLTPMIYLPLLLVGVEEILKKNKISAIFVLVVFASAISSYYFLWMNSIFCIIYFVLRFNEIKPKRFKIFIHCTFTAIKSYLLGIGIGAFYFVPNIAVFFRSNRQSAIIDQSIWPFYPAKYIKRFFAYLITPALGPGNWTKVGFLSISFICLLIMFFKVKKHRALKIGYITMVVSLLLPICALVMMAFSSVTNRWSYLFAFVTALVVATSLENITDLTNKDFLKIFAGICAYIIYIFLNQVTQNVYSLVGIILLLVTFICLFIAKKHDISSKRSQILLSSILLVSIFFHGYMTLDPKFSDYLSEFISVEEFDQYQSKSPFSFANELDVELDNESFYRIDSNQVSKSNINMAIPLNVNSTSIFYNAEDANFIQYLKEIEDADIVDRHSIVGLDSRAFLLELNQVKYWSSKAGSFPVPYGYEPFYVSNEGYTIYKNRNFLPLGFCYDKYITENEFEQLSPIEKQETLMQAVLIENTTDFKTSEPILTSSTIDYYIDDCNNITVKNGVYTVEKANATMKIKFVQQENSEHYIRFFNMNIDSNGSVSWTMKIKNEDENYTTSWTVHSSTYVHTHSLNNYTVNLGYNEKEGFATYTITFPSKGTFTLDSLQVYTQSMENYETYIQNLSEDTLEDIEISLSQVKGKISLNEDKILYYSIPYSSGWKATVDGQPVEIQRANIAFMAIPLTAGNHVVILEYTTPGLALGGIISVFSLLLFLFICKRRKHIVHIGEVDA